MTALDIGLPYFRPWWGHEHPMVVSMRRGQLVDHGFTGCIFQRSRRVDQTSIKKNGAVISTREVAVGKRHRDGAARECGRIDPRQRLKVACQRLGHDAPPRFCHNGLTTPREFGQQ